MQQATDLSQNTQPEMQANWNKAHEMALTAH